MKYLPAYGLLLLLIFSGGRLPAQSKVQVVTKTVERTFAYHAGETIFLQGEKSSIHVFGWNSNEVKVVLRLIAKAPTGETAREALEYQRYILEKKKHTLHLKNYFVTPRGQPAIRAILLAEYEIWVPREAILKVVNAYGNTVISNKNGETSVDARYGNISLDQVHGKGTYKNYFGDFTAKNIGGQIMARFNHTKTSVQGLSGSALFHNTLGDMSLSGLAAIQSLKIVAAKADISLTMTGTRNHRYLFTAEFGDITLAQSFKVLPVSTPGGSASWQYGGGSLPEINVKTTFGNITLDIK
jgi:hypothetical protein